MKDSILSEARKSRFTSLGFKKIKKPRRKKPHICHQLLKTTVNSYRNPPISGQVMQDEIKVKKETVLWSNKLKALSKMMDTMRGNIQLITGTLFINMGWWLLPEQVK